MHIYISKRRLVAIVAAIALCVSVTYLPSADDHRIDKRYHAVLESPEQVYDGDTLSDIVIKIADFSERGEVWPEIFLTDEGVFTRFNLRLAGIDTPEKHPRKTWPDGSPRSEASRDRERALAAKARTALIGMLTGPEQTFPAPFIVKDPQLGKYAGRIVAGVYLPDTHIPGALIDIGQALIQLNLAKPYDGGTKARWD